jgi:hypothetical protein
VPGQFHHYIAVFEVQLFLYYFSTLRGESTYELSDARGGLHYDGYYD